MSWSPNIRGVDRYFTELLRALLKIDQINEYYVFAGVWQTYLDDFRESRNLRIISVTWPQSRLLRNIWHGLIFPLQAAKLKPNLVHLPNTMPLFFKASPTVCTIHDLLEYTCPETFSFIQSRIRKILVRQETKLADMIIAVSDLTSNSLFQTLRIPKARTEVIYSGVNAQKFFPAKKQRDLVQRLFAIDDDYILFVGILERKKNLTALVEAYGLLPDFMKKKYCLVLAGKADNAYNEVKALVSRQRLDDRVFFLGQVEQNLAILYQQASLFVLPSFYEGFGLPVLEAMASGIPVIVSKNVAIAQRLHGCCAIIDPNDPEDVAAKMALMLTDRRLRKTYVKEASMRLADFTWTATAEATLALYSRCARDSSARKPLYSTVFRRS
ncbi:glycosyltransferase family 4 protein [Candidatus Bathyarchaeota archaeon]|nr:glycosyltransferase family 4 protein [Candidatus Bathyarchaeota archaeon]